MFLLKRDYFNKTLIIKGLYASLLLSACIYLNYFNIQNQVIHTIFALLALYQLLQVNRPSLFFAGFFTGILWFYWVSFSFVYYELSFLIPLIIFVFALAYGFLFLATSVINHPTVRIILFISLTYIAPLGFNWFKPEIILLNSYFEPTKLSLLLLFISVWYLQKNKKLIFTALVCTTFILSYFQDKRDDSILPSDLKIAMPVFDLSQSYKWDRKNLSSIVQQNINIIDEAINESNDVVILPETAFPMVLNRDDMLMDMLKKKSKDITIVTGAIYKNTKQYNNSTYLFQNGNIDVAHKVVLVPFGEQIPLPKFIRDFINDVFYDGAQDYEKADKATDFTIEIEQFRNAICYEATHDEIYKNLNGVKYILAISNNAWFTPSIEPTLQKMLMHYYAKKYNVIIYHVANGSDNAVIHP